MQKENTDSAGGVPASAIQPEKTKAKEKKKGERKVTFALSDSPLEEDLALIREDWHEAARSGASIAIDVNFRCLFHLSCMPQFSVVRSAHSEEEFTSEVDLKSSMLITGCVGCGKPGCEGRCLAPQKPSAAASPSDVASCSSSETLPKDLFPAPKPTRTGSVRWTRGELLGEGAYGKVIE